MKNVIILAGTTIGSVLSTCKILSTNYNVKIFIICLDNDGFAKIYRKSRYVSASFSISQNQLISFTKQLINDQGLIGKPIVYCMTDKSCVLVNKHRDELLDLVELTIPSSEILKTFIEKGLAESVAEQHGLTVPKTKKISFSQDIEEIIKSFNFPVILKPTSAEKKYSVGFKTKIINDSKMLIKECNLFIQNKTLVLCQEYIKGDDSNVYFYLFNRVSSDEITECIGVKTLQSPPRNGVMAIGTTQFNSDLSVIARTFLKKINYIGVGGIEFKKYNGKFYFIEMSVRSEGFVGISDLANVSIIDSSFLCLNNMKSKINWKKKQNDNIKYYAFLGWFFTRIRQRKLITLFKEFILLLSNKKHFTGDFDIKDITPFFKLVQNMIVTKYKK